MSSEDSDVSRCSYRTSDGRQCRMLRAPDNAQFCLHHERKTRHVQDADRMVDELFAPISRGFITAASLSQSVARLFAAVAAGRIGPKNAVALSHVADTLLKTISASTVEFNRAYKDSQWLRVVRSSIGNLSEFSVAAPVPDAALSSRCLFGKKTQSEAGETSSSDTVADPEVPSCDPVQSLKKLAREL